MADTGLPDSEVSIQAQGLPKVLVSFPREQVERGYLNWAPRFSRANVELFLLEKELKPGESVTLRWSLQVR